MADAEVREAVPADAAEIARIQLSTWRTVYTELLPPGALNQMDTTGVEQAWRDTLTTGPATVLVATEGPWVVGFCAAGPAPESESAAANGTVPADAATTALVSALLVEPRWGRRGHGGRLLGTMARRLLADGATRGITWVAEADTASISFFHGAGWTPDGTVRTLDAAGRPLRELRLSGPIQLQFERN